MITPKMIISFPKLFKAEENQSGVLKFSCCLMIEKSDKAGVKLIQDAIDKAIVKGKKTKWNGKLPRFAHEPLRDGDAEIESGDKDAGKGYEGRYFINCSCGENDQPGVVGPDGRPLLDAGRIYSGCVVRVDTNPFPYDNQSKGVAWWLNHVMLVEECAPEDRLDGKQSAENAFSKFTEVEGDLD